MKHKPVVAIATKSDRVDRGRRAEHLIAIDQLGSWDEIIPCSATRGDQVEEVRDVLSSHLPVAAAVPRRRPHRRTGERR